MTTASIKFLTIVCPNHPLNKARVDANKVEEWGIYRCGICHCPMTPAPANQDQQEHWRDRLRWIFHDLPGSDESPDPQEGVDPYELKDFIAQVEAQARADERAKVSKIAEPLLTIRNEDAHNDAVLKLLNYNQHDE